MKFMTFNICFSLGYSQEMCVKGKPHDFSQALDIVFCTCFFILFSPVLCWSKPRRKGHLITVYCEQILVCMCVYLFCLCVLSDVLYESFVWKLKCKTWCSYIGSDINLNDRTSVERMIISSTILAINVNIVLEWACDFRNKILNHKISCLYVFAYPDKI